MAKATKMAPRPRRRRFAVLFFILFYFLSASFKFWVMRLPLDRKA